MHLLARQVPPVGFQKRFPSQRPPHGNSIAVFLEHAVFQDAGQEARDTGISSGCFESCPAGDVFFQSDGDIPQASLLGKREPLPDGPRLLRFNDLVVAVGLEARNVLYLATWPTDFEVRRTRRRRACQAEDHSFVVRR